MIINVVSRVEGTQGIEFTYVCDAVPRVGEVITLPKGISLEVQAVDWKLGAPAFSLILFKLREVTIICHPI